MYYNEIITPITNSGSSISQFRIRFYRESDWYYPDQKGYVIKIQTIGIRNNIQRHLNMDLVVKKDSTVLNYAIASRGRIWLAGDSVIKGNIYSAWDRLEISPFNVTSNSTIEGTINTVLKLQGIQNENYQLETLDENYNPVFDEYGNRVFSPEDEVQGQHEGINYDQSTELDIPGMDIGDYNTDQYKHERDLDIIPSCASENREIEYFPHSSGDYSQPRDGTPLNTWNRRLERHVYENQTFTDTYLQDNRNALFRNCTFEGILYIDCYKSGSNCYNNVRFDNCEFNGTIITDVPEVFKWRENCLYFTGEAKFNNTSDIPEAAILAPHFNVNLGNTNPEKSDNNVITGAIVGGIVDVRGNAQIYGTIISMCDATGWSSGYVTNIGATLGDGGSETTEPGDVGRIKITPNPDQMLPSGIASPIVIQPLQSSYYEGILNSDFIVIN